MLGGTYLAAGIEHNEKGDPTSGGVMHAKMNEKRFKQARPAQGSARDLFEVEGNPDAPFALVAWGSIAGVCREALEMAEAEGLNVKLLVPYLLYPIAEEVYRDFFASVKAGFFVELSHQGQLYRILRMYVDLPKGVRRSARSGANPFQPSEVVAASRRRLGAEASHSEPSPRRPDSHHERNRTFQAKDFKSDLKPIWCPGCGDFGVVQALYRALAAVGRPRTRSPSSRASAARAASPATPPPTASTACTAGRCRSPRASRWPTPTCWCWWPAATATASPSAPATCPHAAAATSTSRTS